MADLKPKLRVDVNHNPTKKGIKVQFVLPQTLEGDKKAEATQKLQSKLNQGLEQYNLTVSQDTDVPYSNVIGFLIPIADIKLLIKNAIGGGSAEPAPEEAPAEAPVAEGMEDPEGEWDKLSNEERAGILKKLIPGVENSPIYNSLKGNAATLDNLSAKDKQRVLNHLAMKKGISEVDRMKELAGVKK